MPELAAVHHDCPGGCGAQVPNHLLACLSCWHRLPAGLRLRLTTAYRTRRVDPRPHRQALADALAWYRDHPGGT